MPDLWKLLISTTYRNVRVLLNTDKIKTNSGERSLLRNLGSWLGRLTIARLKPVRQRDLDLKAIIYSAYEQGKMIAVLPFIGKVLPATSCNSRPNKKSVHIIKYMNFNSTAFFYLLILYHKDHCLVRFLNQKRLRLLMQDAVILCTFAVPRVVPPTLILCALCYSFVLGAF